MMEQPAIFPGISNGDCASQPWFNQTDSDQACVALELHTLEPLGSLRSASPCGGDSRCGGDTTWCVAGTWCVVGT